MSYKPDKITTNEEILEALNPVPNFKTRDDIKPWIHDNLDPRGINLVIERSDASKVVFKCKNLYRKSSTPRSTTTKIINGKQVVKRVRRSIPEDSCPFRLRVSYSVKYKNWSVNIIKHEHNLSLCSNFGQGQPSPIDHASVQAARQYGNQAVRPMLSQNTSYYSTTSSTTSSPMSSPYTGSPAFSHSATTTPNDLLDYEPSSIFKRPKLSQTFDQSPLYNEIDPLDQIENSFTPQPQQVQTQDDELDSINQELGYIYGTRDPLADELPELLGEGSSSKHLQQQQFNQSDPRQQPQPHQLSQQHPSPSVSPPQSDHFQLFDDSNFTKLYEQSSNSPQHLNTLQPQQLQNSSQNSLHSSISNTPANNNTNSLNIKQEEMQDNDPLMYLLSSTNQSYSFEELESLDKAMGIDANDKILMSMFQGI